MHYLRWRKSSFSGNGLDNNCVELAASGGAIRVRESEEPGAVVRAARGPLAAFIRGVKAGEFDHLGQ